MLGSSRCSGLLGKLKSRQVRAEEHACSPLLHGSVRVVHGNPLRGRQAQPYPLLGCGQLQIRGVAALPPTLLPDLQARRQQGGAATTGSASCRRTQVSPAVKPLHVLKATAMHAWRGRTSYLVRPPACVRPASPPHLDLAAVAHQEGPRGPRRAAQRVKQLHVCRIPEAKEGQKPWKSEARRRPGQPSGQGCAGSRPAACSARFTAASPAHRPPPPGSTPGSLWVLIKLEVDHCLCELPEGRRRVAAQQLWAGGHLLLAHQEALVVALVALPRQPAPQQEEQRVGKRLEVVTPRCRATLRAGGQGVGGGGVEGGGLQKADKG